MSAWGRSRRVIARVVAAGAAVFWGFLFFGLIDLLTPFVGGEEFADHFLMETGWGLTYLVLVAVPLLVLVMRPGAVMALLELVAVGVSIAIGAGLAGSPPHVLPGVGVVLTAAVVAVLVGTRVSGVPGRPTPLAAIVAVVAVPPAAAYAWEMARSTENPEETWGLDHYPLQAAFAIAVVLVALLTAYAVRRPGRGCWLPACTSACSAIWFGALSLVWPERLGSLGTAWGAAAVVWGIALLAAVAVDERRSATSSGPSPAPTRPASSEQRPDRSSRTRA
ncbi:MAG TPA: hypothetical protein VGK78_11455 [Nocardioides sp.]|uniref:hypothetical protein n=1 Tax=Nocardioides sp. TaxID=35761 RepID=UPI002F3F7DFC